MSSENKVTTEREPLPDHEIWMITPDPLEAALPFVSMGRSSRCTRICNVTS